MSASTTVVVKERNIVAVNTRPFGDLRHGPATTLKRGALQKSVSVSTRPSQTPRKTGGDTSATVAKVGSFCNDLDEFIFPHLRGDRRKYKSNSPAWRQHSCPVRLAIRFASPESLGCKATECLVAIADRGFLRQATPLQWK